MKRDSMKTPGSLFVFAALGGLTALPAAHAEDAVTTTDKAFVRA